MINKQSQELLNRVVSGLPVLFVFKSKVHYDMYFPTADGLLKYDADTYTWVKSEFKTKDELVEAFRDTSPVYTNKNIFHNLDWEVEEDVPSLTNVSRADWKRGEYINV